MWCVLYSLPLLCLIKSFNRVWRAEQNMKLIVTEFSSAPCHSAPPISTHPPLPPSQTMIQPVCCRPFTANPSGNCDRSGAGTACLRVVRFQTATSAVVNGWQCCYATHLRKSSPYGFKIHSVCDLEVGNKGTFLRLREGGMLARNVGIYQCFYSAK